jgi:biotin-(acetyl-CoA carboxylase) ligase
LKQFVARERLLAEVLNNFEEILQKLEETPEVVVNEWRNCCKMIGDQISVKMGEYELHGLFEDVTDEGQIILIDGMEDKHIISFGDVAAI